MNLEEVRNEVETYRDKLLRELDAKIERSELELENKTFKVRKRIEKLERNLFGFDFSTDNDGKNN